MNTEYKHSKYYKLVNVHLQVAPEQDGRHVVAVAQSTTRRCEERWPMVDRWMK